MNTPSLWEQIKARIGLIPKTPITTTKPDCTPCKLQVLRGETDGLHPEYRPANTSDEDGEVRLTRNREELERLRRDPMAYFAAIAEYDKGMREVMYPPLNLDLEAMLDKGPLKRGEFMAGRMMPAYGQSNKTNFAYNLARQMDTEAMADQVELIKQHPELYPESARESDERFVQYVKDNPDLFVDQSALDAIKKVVEKEFPPMDGKHRILVVDSYHPSMHRHGLALMALTAAARHDSPLLIAGSGSSGVLNNFEEMLKCIPVAQEVPQAVEKPWIEMNQQHHRNKKRNRPGRKHGKK